jgi:hypothetical protein
MIREFRTILWIAGIQDGETKIGALQRGAFMRHQQAVA